MNVESALPNLWEMVQNRLAELAQKGQKAIEQEKDTTPLITHIFPLNEIEAAYDLFEKRRDGVMKVAITPPEK